MCFIFPDFVSDGELNDIERVTLIVRFIWWVMTSYWIFFSLKVSNIGVDHNVKISLYYINSFLFYKNVH